MFDRVEEEHGKSALIDVLRKYYHSDLYFDTDGKLCRMYQSLKQGCAVASWLANVVLYHVDKQLSEMKGFYVRYSDDMLYIGDDYEQAMQIVVSELSEMDMKLNPKKVEYLSPDRWFKFLGFSIKGGSISLSGSRIKTFQKEIEARTIKQREISMRRAINQVNNYLYKGDGKYSWATLVLPIVNVDKDIETLNAFVMDAIRSCATNKKKIGGLGSVNDKSNYTIIRGVGKNVSANRYKTEKEIDGFFTLGCMQNALQTSRSVYETLVRIL